MAGSMGTMNDLEQGIVVLDLRNREHWPALWRLIESLEDRGLADKLEERLRIVIWPHITCGGTWSKA